VGGAVQWDTCTINIVGRSGRTGASEKGSRACYEDNAQEGYVGGDLFHPGEWLIEKERAHPAGQRGGEESDYGSVG